MEQVLKASDLLRYQAALHDDGFDDIEFLRTISKEELIEQLKSVMKHGHILKFYDALHRKPDPAPPAPPAATVTVEEQKLNALDTVLKDCGLSEYAATLKKDGYDDVEHLTFLNRGEILDELKGVMKRGHILRIFSALRPAPAESAASKVIIPDTVPTNLSILLTSCGLSSYLEVLTTEGYDEPRYMASMTRDRLVEYLQDVMKRGHVFKLYAALHPTPTATGVEKPAVLAESLSATLSRVGLSEYETALSSEGFDDLRILASLTREEMERELKMKKGHVSKFYLTLNRGFGSPSGTPTSTPSSTPATPTLKSPYSSSSSFSSSSSTSSSISSVSPSLAPKPQAPSPKKASVEFKEQSAVSSRMTALLFEPLTEMSPLSGLQTVPLLPLKEACRGLDQHVKNLQTYIEKALEFAKAMKEADRKTLTEDEAASIYLYTCAGSPTDTSFYHILNNRLREEKRDRAKPWFRYLRLLFTALGKLPRHKASVWRGVKVDLKDAYKKGETKTWWSFSSCTYDFSLLEEETFCGSSGHRTVFKIENHAGVEITPFSAFPHEREILLPPGTEFEVRSLNAKLATDLLIVDCVGTASGSDFYKSSRSFDHSTTEQEPFVPKLKTAATQTKIAADEEKKAAAALISSTAKSTSPSSTPSTSTSSTSTSSTSSTSSSSSSKSEGKKLSAISLGTLGIGPGQFKNPHGLDLDGDRLFICDESNHRVQVWNRKNNKYITQFGSQGSLKGEFTFPTDLVVADNAIYVSDRHNLRVQVFQLSDYMWIREYKVGFKCYGIAVSSSTIFVVDRWNNQVRGFDKSTGQLTIKIGEAGSGQGQFALPRTIALNDEYLYVADSENHRVQIFTHSGVFKHQFGGQGKGEGEFNEVRCVRWSTPHLYVGDLNKIQCFEKLGEYVSMWNGEGLYSNLAGLLVNSDSVYLSDLGASQIQILSR